MQYLKEDIQEKILHIAEEVFSEKGYKDASMREIASRTGITVSNIYPVSYTHLTLPTICSV